MMICLFLFPFSLIKRGRTKGSSFFKATNPLNRWSLNNAAFKCVHPAGDAEGKLLTDNLRLFSGYFWQILAKPGYSWQIMAIFWLILCYSG